MYRTKVKLKNNESLVKVLRFNINEHWNYFIQKHNEILLSASFRIESIDSIANFNRYSKLI